MITTSFSNPDSTYIKFMVIYKSSDYVLTAGNIIHKVDQYENMFSANTLVPKAYTNFSSNVLFTSTAEKIILYYKIFFFYYTFD